TAVPPQEEAEATYDRTAGKLKKRLTLLRKCMESLAAAEKELASLNLKYQEHSIKAEHLKQQLLKEKDGYRQKVLLLSQRRQENDTRIRDLVFETARALRTEERDPSILSQLIQKRITTFHRAEQAVNALAGEQQIFEQGSAVYKTLQNQLRQQQEGHETTLAALEQEIISIQKERREKFKDKSPDQESAALEEALKKAQTKYTDSQRNTVRAKEKYDNSLLNQEKQLRLLRQQEIEYSASENDLLGILQKYDFTTLQEWELFNRSPEVIHSLTNLLQKMDLELQHCRTVLEERKGLHAKLSAELEPGLLREENQKKLAELFEAEKDLREKHSALQVRLRLDQEARSLHEKKLREVEEERHLLNHWKCLYDDFGSTPGTDGTDRFGRIAQGYTFRELLYYANRNLMGTLRKRFTLINDNTDPLELNVIDHCRADQERTSRNLSGGESFEVSLALALGLSEMSSMSQNAKLGNVLLDEGFGTLDDQALESALELLMNLKNTNGKLVGIISHVEKLKERIATQIEVQSSSGMGSLSGAGVVSGEKLSRYLEESGLPGASPGKKRRKKQ
ncbi:MAG: hypothetical protein J6S58_07305, partial [Lentisphaeria bacterium]|nr:hypothetical protein [Lentisphaeria bacterium]